MAKIFFARKSVVSVTRCAFLLSLITNVFFITLESISMSNNKEHEFIRITRCLAIVVRLTDLLSFLSKFVWD